MTHPTPPSQARVNASAAEWAGEGKLSTGFGLAVRRQALQTVGRQVPAWQAIATVAAVLAALAACSLTGSRHEPAPCLALPAAVTTQPVQAGALRVTESGHTQLGRNDMVVSIGAILVNTSDSVAYRTRIAVTVTGEHGRSVAPAVSDILLVQEIPIILMSPHRAAVHARPAGLGDTTAVSPGARRFCPPQPSRPQWTAASSHRYAPKYDEPVRELGRLAFDVETIAAGGHRLEAAQAALTGYLAEGGIVPAAGCAPLTPRPHHCRWLLDVLVAAGVGGWSSVDGSQGLAQVCGKSLRVHVKAHIYSWWWSGVAGRYLAVDEYGSATAGQ